MSKLRTQILSYFLQNNSQVYYQHQLKYIKKKSFLKLIKQNVKFFFNKKLSNHSKQIAHGNKMTNSSLCQIYRSRKDLFTCHILLKSNCVLSLARFRR